ncbi:MAG TPA: hypothetical protein VFB38_02970 [Chthonomonadaceae bacterium]|nr:hypothetical protein [Chthonomonadaceae bacterium]
MAKLVTPGGKPPTSTGGNRPQRQAEAASGLRREAPIGWIIAAAIGLVIALGAGGFYVYNGGWETQAQKQARFQHEIFPVRAARQGMMGPLEAENRRRRERGEPLLQVPPDRHESAAERRLKIEALQQQLQSRQQPGSHP